MLNKKVKGGIASLKRAQLIFYCSIIAFPFLWWAFGFIYYNLRTILFWFQDFDADTGGYYFVGFKTLERVGADFLHASWLANALKNGLKAAVWTTFGDLILGMSVSYYVYKKYRGYKTFHILLFYPTIVSSIVFIVIFKHFVDQAYPQIMLLLTGEKPYGLLMNLDTQFNTLIFFSVFFNLGQGIMVEVSIMANTPPEVVEASHIDGAGPLREFWHVTFPAMYPTLVLSLMGILTGAFGANPYVFSFFGLNAEACSTTLGYHMQKIVMGAREAEYPYLAAMGAYITLITTPVTIITRKVLLQIGPSED